MKIVTAAELSRKTGYPLSRLKEHCRKGRIHAEWLQTRYYIDYDAGIAALKKIMGEEQAKREENKPLTTGKRSLYVIKTKEEMRRAVMA